MDKPGCLERTDAARTALLQGLRAAMKAAHPQGARHFADQLHIHQTTLLHKTDPDYCGDDLTLKQALFLLAATEPGHSLRPLCLALGGMFLTLPSEGEVGADLHRLLSETVKELGDLSDVLLDATAANSPGGRLWTEEERTRLSGKIDAVVTRLRLIQGAAQRDSAPEGA